MPSTQRFNGKMAKTTAAGVLDRCTEAPSNVSRAARRVEFEIVNHRVVGPRLTVFSPAKYQHPTQGERALSTTRGIGLVEIILLVEVDEPLRPHDKIPVLLNDHRIWKGPLAQGAAEVEVNAESPLLRHRELQQCSRPRASHK